MTDSADPILPVEPRWYASYDAGQPFSLDIPYATTTEMFAATALRTPDAPLVHYFGGTLTVRDVDEQSDSLAAALEADGIGKGDRIALYMQNMPDFLISLVAAWKLGGIGVSVNPMYKTAEVSKMLVDSGARVLVGLDTLVANLGSAVWDASDVERVVVTTARRHGLTSMSRLPDSMLVSLPIAKRIEDVLAEFAGRQPSPVELGADDIALLTYTSGTTGLPKGAQATHGNVVFNAHTYQRWVGLSDGACILGVAPLFHVTGLIAHITLSLLIGGPLVLTYRFDTATLRDAIVKHRPVFTIGSITVFIAWANSPDISREDLASLVDIYTGGAPVAPAVLDRFRDRFGHDIHNAYGLTETSSPSHMVPAHRTTRVDPDSGACSVGLPVYGTSARVVDESGAEMPSGAVGELVISGPQVSTGYWNKPEETSESFRDGWFHTGDMALVDEEGWFYIVDRKKDMINASGFKVWPREVEDVLYNHPAVDECAVVGVPDEYRGESVKAFVTVRADASTTEQELIDFAKEHLAAYKYPRTIELVAELPKTVTGKILRRQLR